MVQGASDVGVKREGEDLVDEGGDEVGRGEVEKVVVQSFSLRIPRCLGEAWLLTKEDD